MISRISVRNFKALRDVVLELTPLHVIIGPNDSGKSSALEAIAAMGRLGSVGENASSAFFSVSRPNNLMWQNGDGPIELSATTLGPPAVECGATFGFKTGARPELLLLSLAFNGEQTASTRGQTPEQVSRVFALRDAFLKSVQPLVVYRWQPQYLKVPCAANSARGYQIDASGFGLASVIDTLLGAEIDRFLLLREAFKKLFPSVKNFGVRPARGFSVEANQSAWLPPLSQGGEGKGIFFEFNGVEGQFAADRVSDGLLFVLAVLTLLHVPSPAKTIIIEEPENGIHPKLLRDVFDQIRRLMLDHPSTQLIFTTHSPYVLDSMRPEEVTLLQKSPTTGEVQATRLSDSPMVHRLKDVYSLGEIWTSEGDAALGSVEVVPDDAAASAAVGTDGQ